jgi:hypothetical protein
MSEEIEKHAMNYTEIIRKKDDEITLLKRQLKRVASDLVQAQSRAVKAECFINDLKKKKVIK